MKYHVFSVRDCLLGMFGNLLLYRSDAQATRDFHAAITSEEIAPIAEQYSLYKVGVFFAETGYFKRIEPLLIANGSDALSSNVDIASDVSICEQFADNEPDVHNQIGVPVDFAIIKE